MISKTLHSSETNQTIFYKTCPQVKIKIKNANKTLDIQPENIFICDISLPQLTSSLSLLPSTYPSPPPFNIIPVVLDEELFCFKPDSNFPKLRSRPHCFLRTSALC